MHQAHYQKLDHVFDTNRQTGSCWVLQFISTKFHYFFKVLGFSGVLTLGLARLALGLIKLCLHVARWT